jgi:hypothetical protein
MPDGTRSDGPGYNEDFYAWTQYQAEVLRSMPCDDNRFDRDNVAEEIEDLGKSERNAVRSEVRRIIEHFLKLEYSRSADPRADWMASIVGARAELEERLSSTLRRDLEASLPRLYRNARKQAGLGLRRYAEGGAAAALPEECPYALDQILEDDWYPEPPTQEAS